MTVLIRFDRLRGTEWAAVAQDVLAVMPDYETLVADPKTVIAGTANLINAQVENGADTIPTYEIPTIYGHLEEGVDPAGLVEKAVKYGMFTWEEVCTAEAAQTKGCKENG